MEADYGIKGSGNYNAQDNVAKVEGKPNFTLMDLATALDEVNKQLMGCNGEHEQQFIRTGGMPRPTDPNNAKDTKAPMNLIERLEFGMKVYAEQVLRYEELNRKFNRVLG